MKVSKADARKALVTLEHFRSVVARVKLPAPAAKPAKRAKR